MLQDIQSLKNLVCNKIFDIIFTSLYKNHFADLLLNFYSSKYFKVQSLVTFLSFKLWNVFDYGLCLLRGILLSSPLNCPDRTNFVEGVNYGRENTEQEPWKGGEESVRKYDLLTVCATWFL